MHYQVIIEVRTLEDRPVMIDGELKNVHVRRTVLVEDNLMTAFRPDRTQDAVMHKVGSAFVNAYRELDQCVRNNNNNNNTEKEKIND